jgi:23S rRNA (uracil1939-C5)-methyltransferase
MELLIMTIKKDDFVVVKIEGMNHEGQGVGKIEGFTVFVDGAMQGEIVQIQIKIIKKNYAVGDICEIIAASTERALPFCPVYEKCGGCDLQHMSYRESLNFKKNVIKDALKRI